MLILPNDYHSSLNILETQIAIKKIKDFFENTLAVHLNLSRVSAPLFVKRNSGINDNLSGVEIPVSFDVTTNAEKLSLEIVQSLAKWKRIALKNYALKCGQGIYADMDAIRACEVCDNTHSIYVDQWDWEMVIKQEDRNLDFLKSTVKKIYQAFLETQEMISDQYPGLPRLLPSNITFLTTQDLLDEYPALTPNEREMVAAKKYKAVFIIGIGHNLSNGKPHDSRSPDYDDWDLNGDMIFWNPVLNSQLEMSSMGIRVDPKSLLKQLEQSGRQDRLKLEYHTLLTSGQLPLSIGGGIGQSRICMFFLQKAHIGEVQASIWPDSMRRACENNDIFLL